jgi:putative hydrolase of HD superfamily
MYRMAMLALFAPSSLTSRVDIARVTKMCLFHDVAEMFVGDITPMDQVSKPEKNRRETTTISFLSREVMANVSGAGAHDFEAIWNEFEEGKTDEAKFAQDLDKLELLLQAVEYEREFKGEKDLSSFISVHERILLPEVKEWSTTILKERAAMWEGWAKTPLSDGAGLDDELKKQLDDYYDSPPKVFGQE